MAKSSKKEDTGELQVSIEQFTRTRDSVIVSLSNLQAGLTHVQNGIAELLSAYMKHTASILAGESGPLSVDFPLPAHISAAARDALDNIPIPVSTATTAATQDPKQKKRKREKKERDPNAPKRPLTAAFLYAQAARPYVRQDLENNLGPNQKLEPNAVNLEINKRWNEMPEEEKEKWKASYRESRDKFKVEMKEYLAKTGANADELHDEEEASDEAEGGAIDSEGSEESDEEATAPSPTAKAPTPPASNSKAARPSKRQKTATTNGALVPIAPAAAQTQVPIPIPGTAGKSQVAPSTAEAPTPAGKKDKKKDKKAAPQPIAPAPVKEPSPDDGKKKTKGRSTRNAEPEVEAPAVPEAKKKRDRSKRKSEGASV